MIKLDIDIIFERFKRIAFLFLFFVFIALFFVRHLLAISFPAIIYLVVVALCCVVADKSELIALGISCVSLPNVFQYRYAIIIVIATYLIKNIKSFYYRKYGKRSNFRPIILLSIMAFWEVLHVAFLEQDIVEYFRSFVEITFFFMLLIDNKKNFDYRKIVRYVCFSALAFCTFIILIQLKHIGLSKLINFFATARLGYGLEQYEEMGQNFNPNALALICLVPACAVVQLIFLNKAKALDYILFLGLIIFSIMTMSRKIVVMFAVLFFIMFFEIFRYKKTGVFKTFLYLILSIAVIAVAIIILNKLFPTVIEGFIERFEVEDVSNGRVDTMKDYIEVITFDPFVTLFGTGLQGVQVFKDGYGIKFVPHNGLLELWVCWGIIGIMFFALFLYYLISTSYSGRRRSVIDYLLVAEVFTFVQFSQLFRSGSPSMYFALAYVGMCYFQKTEPRPSRDDVAKTA